MAEENDARIERLEKKSQESRAQMSKMMELIRTLLRDKGQALGLNPQNKTAQSDQRREEPVYLAGFTYSYASNVHMAQPHRCNKSEGSRMDMRLPQHG